MNEIGIVRPTHPRFSAISREFRDCLRAGKVTNNGEYVQAFEAALTERIGAPTIVFNNGHTALMTMLKAFGLRGREVIMPSFTFCSTAHAVKSTGSIPVFADIDPETLTIDQFSVSGLINKYTGAVLAVDPYGIMAPTAALASMGLPVLIDSAPSFGSSPSIPARCDAQIFSFHATKPFSTMEGGALTTLNEGILKAAKKIRNFGQEDDGDCKWYGMNGKMMEICAIIGLKQLEAWDAVKNVRMTNAFNLRMAIESHAIPGVKVIDSPPNQAPIWTYQPVLVDESQYGMSRDGVLDALKERRIVARKYYKPCHHLSLYFDPANRLPVTDRIAEQIIALPVYNEWSMGEIMHVANALRDIHLGAK